MNDNVQIRYGGTFVKPGGGQPERGLGWYTDESIRDGFAKDAVAAGHTVTLEERVTTVAYRTTGILKPETLLDKKRKSMVMEDQGTLFMHTDTKNVYELRYGGELAQVSGPGRIEASVCHQIETAGSPFLLPMSKLVPEGK